MRQRLRARERRERLVGRVERVAPRRIERIAPADPDGVVVRGMARGEVDDLSRARANPFEQNAGLLVAHKSDLSRRAEGLCNAVRPRCRVQLRREKLCDVLAQREALRADVGQRRRDRHR